MNTASFWDRVKILIKAHNVDQKTFAAHIGVPLNTFKGWIHYNRIPDVKTAYEIAAALGVSLNYLAYGKEHDTTEEEKQRRSAVKEAAIRVQALHGQMRDDLGLIEKYF